MQPHIDDTRAIYSNQDPRFRPPLPSSFLDLQMMMTDPKWGLDDVPQGFKDKLSEQIAVMVNNKIEIEMKDSLWERLAFYTRDMRLANLKQDEMFVCRYYIDLAGDILNEGYNGAFMTSLSRSITVMETSQSRDGFLRKRLGTLTSERIDSNMGGKKPGLFSRFMGNQGSNQGGMQQ